MRAVSVFQVVETGVQKRWPELSLLPEGEVGAGSQCQVWSSYRPRAGPLRHGGKPFCHSRPGLPHDLREHDPGRRYPDGADPQRYLPQLRLSPAAPGSGQQAEAGIRATLT